MNSKYYTWRLSNWRYPEIIQVMDDHDHDLVLKQPWSLGNSPLSENLHIISMNHSKQQHMARCQHIPFVPERTDLQRNQSSPSGHKYVLHVCCICMYIIYIHIIYISIINSCRLHSCIILFHAHTKNVKALYQ